MGLDGRWGWWGKREPNQKGPTWVSSTSLHWWASICHNWFSLRKMPKRVVWPPCRGTVLGWLAAHSLVGSHRLHRAGVCARVRERTVLKFVVHLALVSVRGSLQSGAHIARTTHKLKCKRTHVHKHTLHDSFPVCKLSILFECLCDFSPQSFFVRLFNLTWATGVLCNL